MVYHSYPNQYTDIGIVMSQIKFLHGLCESYRSGITFIQNYINLHKTHNFNPIATKLGIEIAIVKLHI